MYPALEKLGLTERETETYVTLLRLGESPVADLLKTTGAHPQIMYRALDGLLKKKLVLISYRRHRKYFRAEDPHLLEKLAEDELQSVRNLIPDLLALQQTSNDAIIRVERGNEAVRTLRKQGIDELPPGGIYKVIGASGTRFYEVMGEFFTELERKRIKKGITRRMLSFESQRQLFAKEEPNKPLLEARYLPDSYDIPSSTNIFNDTVAILIWSTDPIVLTIDSPEVAQSYHQYFDSLWKLAKP
ncbi:hypothetical protein HY523_02060 [Candidatus Berkelbacteria bacterium]|nr:hypothetical protein [Candidatus Berkelbacteria bacterium]